MKKNYKLALLIIALSILAVASYFLFARDLFYKYSDFKKLAGKVEACTIKGTQISIYKYINKSGSIVLTGDNGEYIPCVMQDGAATEQCEAMLSMLSSCNTVLDSNNNIYSASVHSKVPLIVNNIAINADYESKYIADIEKAYIVRTFASADMTLVLKNEKDIASGHYILTQNGAETTGEWIQSDNNKNKIILMDRTDLNITLTGNNVNFSGKVLVLKK